MGRPRAGLTESTFIVLGLLSFGRRSGYDLLKLGEQSIGGFHRMPSKAQVYEELKKIEAEGLATSTSMEQAGRPAKRLYRITPRGRAALRKWLEEVDAPPLSGLTLTVIFFGAQLSGEKLAERLQGSEAEAKRRLAELRAIRDRLEANPKTLHPLIVARAGIAQYEACVRWARQSLRELDAGQPG